MKRFVVFGSRTTTSGEFSLNDLSGGTGRLDVLLRCINTSFFLSHGLREDVELFLVLGGPPDPPKTIRMNGQALRGLNPDERSAAGLVKKALGLRLPPGLEKQASDGVYVKRLDLAGVIEGLDRDKVVYLHEEGADVREGALSGDEAFVLGDDIGLSPADETLLTGCRKIALGPRVLHAHQCITLLHNELDRRGL